MSYNKRTWATGNVVGAVDLNRIEDRIANIDVGYSCSGEWVTLIDESVITTVEGSAHFALGGFTYSEPVTADEIKVTFNGVEYTCQKIGDAEYGAPYNGSTNTFDWSEYPFNILLKGGVHHFLSTETAGTYQVKIEAYEETIETSECFDKARGYSCNESTTLITNETINSTSF